MCGCQALQFEDTFTQELPGDEEVSYKRRQVIIINFASL